MKLPRAVIFDWDNTLVDSWPAIAAAINHTRAAMGVETWPIEKIRTVCTRAARDIFPQWFGDDWKRAYDIYYRGFDEIRRSRDITTLPGARDLLDWLKGQSIPSFVVSNKRGDYLRLEVERLKWEGYFVAVAGAQDAPSDKPSREHVDFALASSGVVAGADVWFIGDSETDVLCAQNAGCTPVFIGSDEEGQRLRAARSFSDCQSLLNMLYGLAEKQSQTA